MQAEKELRFSVPEISEALGFRREQFHPDELLSDEEFPLDYPETRPEDKYEEWNRPDLRAFTDNIGAAWEDKLAERYDMDTVRIGPVDLKVTEGKFEDSPVQAKTACIINSKGQRDDGSWKTQPGLLYVKRPEMESLAEMNFEDTCLDPDEYSPPALLHGSVHYPREDMPKLPDSVPTATIESPDDRNYSFETAYVGEIVTPVGPLYKDNQDAFNSGSRQAWPLNWRKAFGRNIEDESIMRYWRD
ncbi:hypothetical protein GKQ38_02810 [Candidatus Nanohaloarchaea archaeon]|nr:hypothetical protein GKQ38_02810 [Candidatus Nanohaloarchaea archaeon]